MTASEWNEELKSNFAVIVEDLKLPQKKEDWIWCIFVHSNSDTYAVEHFQVDQEAFNKFATDPQYTEAFEFWKFVLQVILKKEPGYIPKKDVTRVIFSLPLLYQFTDKSSATDREDIKAILNEINRRHFGNILKLDDERLTKEILIEQFKSSVTTVEGTTSNFEDRSTARQQKQSGTLGAEKGAVADLPTIVVPDYESDDESEKPKPKYINLNARNDGYCAFHALDLFFCVLRIQGYSDPPGLSAGAVPISLQAIADYYDQKLQQAIVPFLPKHREMVSELNALVHEKTSNGMKLEQRDYKKYKDTSQVDMRILLPEMEQHQLTEEEFDYVHNKSKIDTIADKLWNRYLEVLKRFYFFKAWIDKSALWLSLGRDPKGKETGLTEKQLSENKYILRSFESVVNLSQPDIADELVTEKTGYEFEKNLIIADQNQLDGRLQFLGSLKNGQDIDFEVVDKILRFRQDYTSGIRDSNETYTIPKSEAQKEHFAIFHNNGSHWQVIVPKRLWVQAGNPLTQYRDEQSRTDDILKRIEALNAVLKDKLSEKERQSHKKQVSQLQEELQRLLPEGKYRSMTNGVY